MSKNMAEPDRTQRKWRLRVAYWISNLTRAQAQARALATTHTPTHGRTHAQKYVTRIGFHGNNGFVNAPQRCVTRTLRVLVLLQVISSSVASIKERLMWIPRPFAMTPYHLKPLSNLHELRHSSCSQQDVQQTSAS